MRKRIYLDVEQTFSIDVCIELFEFLKEKGMQVVENPDVKAFRAKVAGLKDMDLYQNPKVKQLLNKMLQATR